MTNDRSPFGGMTEAEIDHIADRAAQRALQKVYAEVGQHLLKKIAWALGVVAVSLMVWLSSKGYIK